MNKFLEVFSDKKKNYILNYKNMCHVYFIHTICVTLCFIKFFIIIIKMKKLKKTRKFHFN